MCPADQLVYNDAQWLAGNHRDDLRLAHSELAHSTAERLSLKSLRYLFLVDQQMSSSLHCPAAALVSLLLASHQLSCARLVTDT